MLLLGDALEDLGMVEGVNHECIIKIGFLNTPNDEKLNKFSEKFDTVILNDGSLSEVCVLLNRII